MTTRQNLILSISLLISGFSFAQILENPDIDKLKYIFEDEISVLMPETDYINWAKNDVLTRILENGEMKGEEQFFVFIDRNPNRQNLMIGYYDCVNKEIIVIGWDKVSTGNPVRKGYYITPIGIFKNSLANIGYRAEGTKNQNGWRGLGKKGSRVWDFGWQKTKYSPKSDDEIEIRLLMHATDPDFGEPRLGQPDSKGCVRISAKSNHFLDHYGILDYDYENNANSDSVAWLLSPNRETVDCLGKFMIVGDSSPVF